MENFAYRCSDWVLWNVGPWSEGGWILINAVFTVTRPGSRRRSFTLSWNGERFGDGKEFARLSAFDAKAPDLLRVFLARMVVPPRCDEVVV